MKKKKKYWFPTIHQVANKIPTYSWFDIHQHKNPEQSFNKIKKENEFIKTYKYKIYPTKEQDKILKSWLDSYTTIYNYTNNFIKNYNPSINFFDIRKSLKGILDKECDKTNIPKHYIDYAIKHCCSMYKSAKTNLKKKNIKSFEIKDLDYKRRRQTMVIEKESFSSKTNGFAVSILGLMKSNISFKNVVEANCILQYDMIKKEYYLLCPTTRILKIKKKKDSKCGIDIGVRTFLTIYSENQVVEVGKEILPRIDKHLKKEDKLQELRSKNIIRYTEFKRKYDKVQDKLTNLIDELHKKTINLLGKTFEIINIGKVSISSMISNIKGNLHDITKRRLCALKHYMFRTRLVEASKKWGITVNEVSEYKTSITCHNCLNEKKDLGSKKTYSCNNCGIVIDRDVNAGINIYNL